MGKKWETGKEEKKRKTEITQSQSEAKDADC